MPSSALSMHIHVHACTHAHTYTCVHTQRKVKYIRKFLEIRVMLIHNTRKWKLDLGSCCTESQAPWTEEDDVYQIGPCRAYKQTGWWTDGDWRGKTKKGMGMVFGAAASSLVLCRASARSPGLNSWPSLAAFGLLKMHLPSSPAELLLGLGRTQGSLEETSFRHNSNARCSFHSIQTSSEHQGHPPHYTYSHVFQNVSSNVYHHEKNKEFHKARGMQTIFF